MYHSFITLLECTTHLSDSGAHTYKHTDMQRPVLIFLVVYEVWYELKCHHQAAPPPDTLLFTASDY